MSLNWPLITWTGELKANCCWWIEQLLLTLFVVFFFFARILEITQNIISAVLSLPEELTDDIHQAVTFASQLLSSWLTLEKTCEVFHELNFKGCYTHYAQRWFSKKDYDMVFIFLLFWMCHYFANKCTLGKILFVLIINITTVSFSITQWNSITECNRDMCFSWTVHVLHHGCHHNHKHTLLLMSCKTLVMVI